jgi:carboxyl-terminal processing protease
MTWVRCWFLLGCLNLALLVIPAQAMSVADEIRRQAEHCERDGQWDRACELYEGLLRNDRQAFDLRERYTQCLRRAQQVRRHRDASYRSKILSLPVDRALDLYEEVLGKLQSHYVDRDRTDTARLFREGVRELSLAFGDETFRQDHLAGARVESLIGFQNRLDHWVDNPVRSLREARDLARDLARAAQQSLGLRATVTVLELTCGACHALDEFTAYLTPAQLDELYATFEGHYVGVGAEVAARGQSLVITQVLPGSPAALAAIKVDDRVLRIDRRAVDRLSAEAAADLLRGEVETVVELEIAGPGEMPRVVKLTRQPFNLPSLGLVQLIDDDIGFVQLLGFQKSTVQELDDAVLRLKSAGMKVLVLDIRGNSGGLFKVAVQVAERFLAEGVIVSTQGQLRAYNKTFHAQSGMSALDVPLVLLVDGDTASAAEVVAGALKEHQRGTLVGQPTFGKGSIQCVLDLRAASAGLRVTVAKFSGPHGQTYLNRGVTPHLSIGRGSLEMMPIDFWDEPQLRAARQEARRLRLTLAGQ